jgi:hypothetical protein
MKKVQADVLVQEQSGNKSKPLLYDVRIINN